jgi:hypothetical protein
VSYKNTNKRMGEHGSLNISLCTCESPHECKPGHIFIKRKQNNIKRNAVLIYQYVLNCLFCVTWMSLTCLPMKIKM